MEKEKKKTHVRKKEEIREVRPFNQQTNQQVFLIVNIWYPKLNVTRWPRKF